jgi:hypothetical protein
MVKETPVLRRQDGMYDRLRNLAQGDPDLKAPRGPVEGRNLFASGVEADRRKIPFPKVRKRRGPPRPDQAQPAHEEEAHR